MLEIREDADKNIEFVFKFAQELVNAGLYFDMGEQGCGTFILDNVKLVGDALWHVSAATRTVAAYHILPWLGYGR